MNPIDQPNGRARDSVFLFVEVAGPGGAGDRFRARNLSSTGVCVDNPMGLIAGMQLVAKIGQVERIAAEVMWVRQGRAGLKFAAPIDPAKARSRPAKSLDPKAGWGRVNAR